MKLVAGALSILLAVVSAAASDSPKALGGGQDPTIDGDAGKLQPRIINGIDAPVNRYPYTASVQKSNDHFCGGSLIAPDLVITAAHCSVALLGSSRIVLNPHKLSDPIEASEVFFIEDYVMHPFYKSLSTYDHDYIIIKLTGSSSNPTVRLNTDDNLPVTGSPLQVMGWGTTVTNKYIKSDTLQEIDVVAITNEGCSKASRAYKNEITPDMLCAAEVNKGSCQGDSGGPLVIAGSSSDEDVQVGIVSWGIGCAEAKNPGVFARIEEEFDWIRSQVCRLSSKPPDYFSCDGGEPSDGNDNGENCFSDMNTVEVLGKGLVTMESINIGDSVRVGPGNEFARVYSFGHYDKNMHAEYVQIRTDVSASPLELTKDHMVFVQDGSVFKSVPASAVNVGDKLIVANGDDVTEVRKIERVTRRGAFAPFTKTGTIVVSGIVASNYISLMDEAPVSMQWMAHAFNAPHRMVCALSFEICENETYTNGISDWVYEPLRLGQWLAQQNAVVNFSAYMAFIVFFSIFSFIEQLTVSPLILSAVVTTCLVLKLTSKKAKTLL